MLSNGRRSEIATFLKLRRARLQPEHVGLSRGVRRRTPGLRREEVAELAGISTEWYAWLEQTRNVHPSMDALQRIAIALRLEPAEQQHLLTLGGYGPESGHNGSAREAVVSPQLQRLMDQLDCCPAWIMGARSDILAWNRAATVVHGDLDRMSGIERNGIHQLFLNAKVRHMLVDWEAHARDCVAKLRLTYANYIDDPWFNELIGLLMSKSPEFARWWDEHDVRLPQDGVKVYDHPTMGRLVFDYAILQVAGGNGIPLHLITYVPASGTETQEKMRDLMNISESFTLRPETPADIDAIERVTVAAFLDAPHTDHNEQHIVRALREAGVLSLSLVAEREGEMVGHVAVSPVSLSDGTSGWVGLGPVSVIPARQGQGIGSALIREALERLRANGASGCVVLGEPGYYGRFGFRAVPGLTLPGLPAEYFMALAFGHQLPNGQVAYHAAFEATADSFVK